MGTEVPFPCGKPARAGCWAPKLPSINKNSWSYTSIPPRIFLSTPSTSHIILYCERHKRVILRIPDSSVNLPFYGTTLRLTNRCQRQSHYTSKLYIPRTATDTHTRLLEPGFLRERGIHLLLFIHLWIQGHHVYDNSCVNLEATSH
jgi:hypothetical protein